MKGGINLEWNEVITIPLEYGDVSKGGVSGAFSGIIDGQIILAGDAIFPARRHRRIAKNVLR